MCGIVGYIGEKSAKEILVSGLKNLEYRGYDSSGIALKNNDNIKVVKSVGKIKNLEEKLEKENLDLYKIGIAHTRWATHGEANLVNAHPHTVGKVTIVHKGIIENAKELKDELISLGVNFNSETDTEVIAALINKYLENDIIKTLTKVMSILKGSYALGIMIEEVVDKIYVAKKDSPLVIGIGEGENFFASDITAINMFTNKFVFLDDYDIAEVKKENIKFYKDCKKVEKEVNTINIDVNSKSSMYDFDNVAYVYNNIYKRLCNKHCQEVTQKGFCDMIGIEKQTLYNWSDGNRSSSNFFDLHEKIMQDNEESLFNLMKDRRNNPMKYLPKLNKVHAWNMPGVREVSRHVINDAASLPKLGENVEQLEYSPPLQLSEKDTQFNE